MEQRRQNNDEDPDGAPQAEPENVPCEGDILPNDWTVLRGSYGRGVNFRVRAVKNKKDGRLGALKIENSSETERLSKLVRELRVMTMLQDRPYSVQALDSGTAGGFRFLVMTALTGANLATLRNRSKNGHFSVATALRLSARALLSIKQLHDVGVVHRDVKPANLVLAGPGHPDPRAVIIVDFDLAKSYAKRVNDRWMIKGDKEHEHMYRGTCRYMSRRAHNMRKPCRADDMWSWFYLTVEFRKLLPWTAVEDEIREVARRKAQTTIEDLVSDTGIDGTLSRLGKYLSSLDFYARPDYSAIFAMLSRRIYALGVHFDDPYEWETIDARRAAKQDDHDGMEVSISDNSDDDTRRGGGGRQHEDASCSPSLSRLMKVAVQRPDDVPGGRQHKMEPKKSSINDRKKPAAAVAAAINNSNNNNIGTASPSALPKQTLGKSAKNQNEKDSKPGQQHPKKKRDHSGRKSSALRQE